MLTLLIEIVDQGNCTGTQRWNDVDYASNVAMSRRTEQMCTNREKQGEPYIILEEEKYDLRWRDRPVKMTRLVYKPVADRKKRNGPHRELSWKEGHGGPFRIWTTYWGFSRMFAIRYVQIIEKHAK